MDLNELTVQINTEYEQSLRSAKDGIKHAINIGMLLKQAKEAAKRGQWRGWVEQNFVFGVRQAQKYMRVAEHGDFVLANANSGSLLDINKALRMIAAARREDHPEFRPFDINRHLKRGKHLIRKWLDKAPTENRGKLRGQLAEWADSL